MSPGRFLGVNYPGGEKPEIIPAKQGKVQPAYKYLGGSYYSYLNALLKLAGSHREDVLFLDEMVPGKFWSS